MATSRSGFVLISLIAGAAIGVALHASGIWTSIFTAKGVRAIVVGPDPSQLNYKKLKVSKGAGDVVFWVAKTKTDKLRIEFDDEIFSNMTKLGNGRWLPKDCGTSRVCYSDEIKPEVEYKEGGYKYWQILIDPSNTEHPADGHIIIER